MFKEKNWEYFCFHCTISLRNQFELLVSGRPVWNSILVENFVNHYVTESLFTKVDLSSLHVLHYANSAWYVLDSSPKCGDENTRISFWKNTLFLRFFFCLRFNKIISKHLLKHFFQRILVQMLLFFSGLEVTCWINLSF